MREGGGEYRILVGKREATRPLERPGGGWENNIKMDLQDVRWRHGLDLSGSG
jgi:hypothetical protein